MMSYEKPCMEVYEINGRDIVQTSGGTLVWGESGEGQFVDPN